MKKILPVLLVLAAVLVVLAQRLVFVEPIGNYYTDYEYGFQEDGSYKISGTAHINGTLPLMDIILSGEDGDYLGLDYHNVLFWEKSGATLYEYNANGQESIAAQNFAAKYHDGASGRGQHSTFVSAGLNSWEWVSDDDNGAIVEFEYIISREDKQSLDADNIQFVPYCADYFVDQMAGKVK